MKIQQYFDNVTITLSLPELKNFFDVLEVVEGDVEECIAVNTEGGDPEIFVEEAWTKEEAARAEHDYLHLKGLMGHLLYPDQKEQQ